MFKQFSAVAVGLVVIFSLSCAAQAQSITQLGKNHSLGSPTVSPYLNLLTVNNFGIAGGYQTLVKPFVDDRKAINANAAGISQLQSRGGGGGGGAHYMNYSHYYSMGGPSAKR